MEQRAFALHPSQYEVYVDQLMNPESPHYNIGLYVKIKGTLNKELFRSAVKSSSEVFNIFNTQFDFSASEPFCYLDEGRRELEVAEMDFSGLESPESAAVLWMQNQFNTPFILRKETLLFQFVLIRVTSDEHWFFFRYHHLLIDGYGFNIWVNYVATKYRSLTEGIDYQPEYPSYKEAAIAVANYRNSPDYELDLLYWKGKIPKKPLALLSKNASAAVRPSRKNGKYYVNLSTQQREALDALLLATRSNLHRLTIAALLIYFGKTTGQSEIIFGLPVHKRGVGDLRRVVGMFSGILPFKGVFKEETILADLLKTIGQSIKNDYSHQDCLIIDLIKVLDIKPSDNFIYDVLINYIPFKFELDFGAGLQATPVGIQNEYQDIPLQVIWRDYGSQHPLELALHYSYKYFTDEQIELLAGRIVFILEQFPAAIAAPIGSLDILPPGERLLLEKFNATATSYPQNLSVVDLFERQVARTPEAVALVFEGEQMSYRELDERSNQLGHYLKSKGVKEEILVPICIERSVAMLVGILGILKAGGAYVPLDPEYPQQRLLFMLQDTRASLVVCSQAGRSKLPQLADREVVDLDADWSAIGREGKHPVPAAPGAQHLAYVIYTSGSTGTPKGVMIEHRSLVASTLARESYYERFGSMLLVPSFAFDSSVAVIFGTLLTGGRLIMCESSLLKDIGYVREILKKVDSILCVPSYYRLLLEEEAVETSSLSKILFGGEKVDEQLVNLHFDKTKNIPLYNEYGPTEYTVWATVAKIEAVDNRITIGAPIANTSVYIVAKDGSLNPIGVTGEICIAGAGLARGYLNNAELTNQKFVSDPFSKETGGRMYRTGDLGRLLPEGRVEFVGRMDNQVKILGNRIELGEVESVLLQCEIVRQAVVLAQEDKQGGKKLVGYVVPHVKGIDREVLRQHVSSQLPAYMVPALWVELTKLPLTANGKVDRQALPAATSEAAGTLYTAPRNATEAMLSTLWQEVLKVEKVGVHDNFFELGGDSLRTIQVVGRAKRLGYALQAKDLFLHQTVERLARAIAVPGALGAGGERKSGVPFPERETAPSQDHPKSLIPAKTGGHKLPLYLVCGGGGTVFTFQKFIDLLADDQPVYVLQQPTEARELAGFPADIEGIAARYVADILTQNPTGPYALSGHCIGGIVAWEMARQLEAMGKTVALLAMFDTIAKKIEMAMPEKNDDFYAKAGAIRSIFSNLYSKIRFEAFLLKNHTKYAVDYKIITLKSLLDKVFPDVNQERSDNELKIYVELGNSLGSAYRNYRMTPTDRPVIVFYAKDHYHFLDKNRNISYKKFELSDHVKNRWTNYVESVVFYEIEGEHSTMFDPKYGGKELASTLQGHLDKYNLEG